eukprot:m.63659 g.63659  ORF g.63659 m.63659 type:complete len:578 (-) comp8169_c0_seq2:259-1992(-)
MASPRRKSESDAQRRRKSSQGQPPGSVGSTFLSDSSYSFWKDPMGFVNAKRTELGPVFQCRLMNTPTIFVTSHEVATELLSYRHDKDLSLPQGYSQFLDGIFGQNMMTIDGGGHERLASMLHEVLGPGAVDSGRFDERITSLVESCGDLMTERFADGASHDLYDILKQVATRASLSLFLGVDIHDDAAVAELTALTKTHWHGITSVPVKVRIPGLSFMKSRRSAASEAADSLRDIIAQRYASDGRQGGTTEGRAVGKGHTDGHAVDTAADKGEHRPGMVANDGGETVFDGLKEVLDRDDTVEHTLMFISALIPKAVAALMTQLMLVLDGPTTTHACETLRHAVRVDAACRERVVREVERCFPPFFACRRVVATTVSVAGYTFPEGYTVMVVTPSVNKDPAVFGQGDTFNPDRWSGFSRHTSTSLRHPYHPPATMDVDVDLDNDVFDTDPASTRGDDTAAANTHPHANPNPAASSPHTATVIRPSESESAPPHTFTFGGGPRACIGQYIMRPLLRALTAMIVSRFDWDIAPEEDRKVKWLPTMRPVAPVMISFRLRDAAEREYDRSAVHGASVVTTMV